VLRSEGHNILRKVKAAKGLSRSSLEGVSRRTKANSRFCGGGLGAKVENFGEKMGDWRGKRPPASEPGPKKAAWKGQSIPPYPKRGRIQGKGKTWNSGNHCRRSEGQKRGGTDINSTNHAHLLKILRSRPLKDYVVFWLDTTFVFRFGRDRAL